MKPWEKYAADGTPSTNYGAPADENTAFDPTEGMSGFDKFAAGAGKAVSDLWLGARQLTGNATQEEVDEVKARDAALMNTGAGFAGNIAGNIATAVMPGLGIAGVGRAAVMPAVQAAGKYLLSSPASVRGAITQGTLGATQGLLQPTATNESTLFNTALGGVGGALVPAAGMAMKGSWAAIEPMYEGGRQAILGRALREASGRNASQVQQNLRAAPTLVPGSAPTAAEVADSGGIAALQRAAAAVDPEAYATRATQQNEARIAALQAIQGAPGARNAADAAREAAAGPLYRQAMLEGVDPNMAQMLQPQIKNLMERMPKGVLGKAKELARMNGEVLGKEGSVQGLHYVKLAVDDLLSGAKQTGIGKQTQRSLVQFKDDLLTVLDDLSPKYKVGRESFYALSRPINQMDVAANLAETSINKLTGQLQPQAYARSLSDDLAAQATGFNKATLANTMEPSQLATLEAIKQDLARSVKARDLGRGAGSDTVQKLAMTNLLQRSGVPLGVLNTPGLGRLGNWAYSVADKEMRDSLARALLDPRATADLMEKGIGSAKAQRLAELLRSSLSPAAIGLASSVSDVR